MYKNNVAIYLRKSRMDSDSESVEETLTRHSEQLLDYANKNDITIIQVYKEVVSGESLYLRPQMCSLLQGVEQNLYSAILCMDIDRLGRSSQKDSGIIYEALQEHNVFIITPNKTYDLNNAMDELSVDMQSFLARQELKTIKRRLRRGTEKTCRDGYHVTEPPYGYRRCYIDKHPSLEIYEPEAEVVRMVFNWYVNDRFGSHTIADKLNQLGYKPRKGEHFSRTTVRFFLSNPTYTGKIVWNRRKHIRPKFVGDKHKNVDNPEKDWIVSEGIHPAIISQEIFDEAQKIRLSNTRPPTFTGVLQNPFAGLVYCKNCGLPMQRQYSAKSGNRLLCTNSGCNRSIKAEYVENRIKGFLQKLLDDSMTTTSKKTDKQTPQIRVVKSTLSKFQQELKTVYTQKEHIHDLLEQQIYDTNTFLERNKILSDKIKSLQTSINDETHKLEHLEAAKPIQCATPYIGRLLNNYHSLTAAEKNELFKLIFSRIEYLRSPQMQGQDFELDIKLNYSI